MIDSGARARAASVVAAIVGLIIALSVIGYFNFGGVLTAIRPIGATGFLAVVAAQVGLFIPLGLAWWLLSSCAPARAPAFVWGRLMREAASDVLPFSQLGGMAIATRVAVLGGVGAAEAFGSCVVDITFEVIAQLIYTLIGVALLAHQLGFDARINHILAPMLVGVATVAVCVGGFIFLQRRGLNWVEALVGRLAPSVGSQAGAVIRVVEAAYGKPLALWGCLGLHMFCWFGAAGGTWLILSFIGRPLPYLSVVAMESLLFAIRNAAFFVPSGLGVQEGAYVILGSLFGLPPDAALALSLLKRARDVAVGVPLLLIWQIEEGRGRLHRA